MSSYQISDVERLIGVKAHVLRYWEREISLLQPKKDAFGRRSYTNQDMRVLLRLKHLLYERRFTIEGAREQLLREASDGAADLRGLIGALRSDLITLFFILQKYKDSHGPERTIPPLRR